MRQTNLSQRTLSVAIFGTDGISLDGFRITMVIQKTMECSAMGDGDLPINSIFRTTALGS